MSKFLREWTCIWDKGRW